MLKIMTQSPRARAQWMNPPRRVHPFPTPTVNICPPLSPTPTVNDPHTDSDTNSKRSSIPDPNSKHFPTLTQTPTVNANSATDPSSIHTLNRVWIFFENSLADRIKFIIFVLVIEPKT